MSLIDFDAEDMWSSPAAGSERSGRDLHVDADQSLLDADLSVDLEDLALSPRLPTGDN